MHPWTGSRDDIRAVRDGDGISSSWKGIESANGRRLIDLLHPKGSGVLVRFRR